MFLHLGRDALIPVGDVIAIIDAGASAASGTGEFLTGARSEGQFVDLADGQPNAYVVTRRRVYASAISSLTLKKRAGFIAGFDPAADGGGDPL